MRGILPGGCLQGWPRPQSAMTQGVIVCQPRELTIGWAQRVVSQHAARATVQGMAVLSLNLSR